MQSEFLEGPATMDIDTERRALLREYLLGGLSEDEVSQVETQMLADREFHYQVQAVEEELIDEYLNGELIRQDLVRFEDLFLSTPGGYEQVELARTLRQYAMDTTRAQAIKPAMTFEKLPRWRVFSFPRQRFVQARIALLVFFFLLASLVWLVTRVLHLQNEIDQLRAGRTQPDNMVELQQEIHDLKASNEGLRAELRTEQERKALLEEEIAAIRANGKGKERGSGPGVEESDLIAATLRPGGARGPDQRNTLEIKPDTKRVRLQLILSKARYKTYSAVVESDSQTIWTARDLAVRRSAGGKNVQLTISTELLPAGDYLIKLNGITADGQSEESDIFYFRVMQKRR